MDGNSRREAFGYQGYWWLVTASLGLSSLFLTYISILILPLFNSSINHRYISCFIPFEGERGGGR